MAETKVVRRKWFAGPGTIVATLLATVFSLLFSECPGRAARPETEQPGAQCLACHGDKSMSTTRGGKTVSLYVDGKKFAASVHGSFGCTGCHADLEGKELPHETPLARVNCGTCHDDRAGATCPVGPRKGHCARRPAGAPLCELPRKPRNLSSKGLAVSGGAAESAIRLRPVPSRRNSSSA